MTAKTQTKGEITKLIHQNEQVLKKFGVEKLGLFGSFTRNKQTNNSDVDFVVFFAPQKKDADNYLDLAFFLEDLLKRKVELLTPESMSPYIKPYILQELEYVL